MAVHDRRVVLTEKTPIQGLGALREFMKKTYRRNLDDHTL